jgi:hypothetical protein
MAEIVLGLGTSHTPMLYTEPEHWPKYEARDRKANLLDHEGKVRAFDELVAAAGPEVAESLTSEAMENAYDTCQHNLDRLADTLLEALPDAVIIIGDDQKELFQAENLPAILIYLGETILNKERPPKPAEPVWWSQALARYYGDGKDEECPVHAELARHLIGSLVEQEFDVAQSSALPEGLGEGHAFAFIHSRIFRRRPFPVVPIFLNTYYPPNQPTPRRCYRLGQKIRGAVEHWDRDARVAVVASGGLSHFVIDQELDASVLTGLEENDTELLTTLPAVKLNSGTSEIRNWIAMHGATEHLSHQWTGYVPAYRTAAGTGTGCGFGIWK